MLDLAALLVPGRTLTADEAALLRAALGVAPWQARKRRLDARDDAVCAAMGLLCERGPLAAARRLHAAWMRVARGARDDSAELHDVVCTIHASHDGAVLSVGQLLRIAREGRTPPVA